MPRAVFMVGAGVNSVMTVAVYDKSLRLSRASLEGPRLGQALNFQVTRVAGKVVLVAIFLLFCDIIVLTL